MTTPLASRLRDKIATSGPITVAEFMETALADPEYGYYRTRDPLGVAGDFTTAPEISQMFGEMVGLWLAVVWQSMGSPSRVLLVEAGPGRGTLMADILRAGTMVPGFPAAVEVHLVETSPALRQVQARALTSIQPIWHDDLSSVPNDAPLLLVANEFLDALPVHQYVREAEGWVERVVGLDADGGFCFQSGPSVTIEAPVAEAGAIFEISPAVQAVAAQIAQRVQQQGGAALLVDYGHEITAVGETLQAVRHHAYAGVLDDPGEVDLTAHVDFQAVAKAASGVQALPLLTQGRFLRTMGIELRADRLARAQPEKSEDILRACQRLIHPAEMGTLFKVIALVHSELQIPPGFSSDDH